MELGNKFPVGRPVDVYVTHVQDESGNFFVQINNEEAGKLDELMEEIDLFISNGQSHVLTANDIEVGVIYLAQYSVDAKWYRARVKAVKPAGLCDVHFIDYGNTEQIPVKFLRHAQPAFLQLHQQAFECELDGITKFRGPSFQSAISAMKELILEQELVCVTTSVNSGILLAKLFTDASCNSSILDSLLSQVQRTPQPAPISDNTTSSSNKKYSIVSLTKGEYLDFHVSHVQDPYSFSCQLLEEIPKILELLDELAEEYSDVDVPLLSSSVGYPCCAKFYEDDCWYRAVITNSSAVASGTIDVKFVDYGNSQTTSLKDVKGLKEKYLSIPMQAIECSLYGVQPEGNTTDWSLQAKELFSKLTSEKHIIAEICNQESTGKYQVRLTDMTGDMDMQLDQILIAAKYAEKTSTNTSLTAQASQHSNVQVSKPTAEPPKPTFSFNKEAISPGKEEKVLVSSIDSPSEFYCMLYRTSPKLEKLMADIARHYSGLGRDDEWLSSPSVGDLCCARFSEDKSWYRAIVKDVQSSGKVKVQFIDYGNYDTVIPKDVKRLAPQFSELPRQAIGCTMHRICPNGQDWKHMDIKKFEELALEYTGKLTVISENADGMKNVELLITLKGKEVNVAEAMLLSGNARLVEGACAQSENLPSISSKKFPKLNLPLGMYEDIFITHVDDPANFWCQLVKRKDELDAVMNAVDEHCTSLTTPLRSPSLGIACCAQYSDDAWYRANISGVMKNHQVEVHFVDYGNYDTVPLSRLRIIKPDLMNLPAQAFKCRLEQMDTKNATPFSQEVIDKFIDLTVDKELVGMIASYDESAQQYLVSCTDTSGGNTLDVYEQIASLLPQSSIKECIIPKQVLKPGQREHVCITTVTGTSKFYCQLMRSASQFDAMMNNMDEHYNKLTSTQEDMTGLQPGDYCVAKYSEDDSWYRAKIIDSKINVHYVDFGNGEQLSAKSIKRLVPTFAQLPEQVLLCTLAGDTSGLSDSQFVDLTLDKEFDVEIVSLDNNDIVTVNLYTRDTKKPVIQLLTKEKPKPAVNIQQTNLAVGVKETVYTTFAVDVSKFYVQLSKSGDSLSELMNKIHEYYSNLTETQDTLESPQVGMFCIANFSEDNGWYRAKVVAVHSDSLEVLYIDYGNSEVIPLARAKALKPEFSSLPSQALHCALSGVAAVGGDETSSNFLQLVEDPEMPFDLEVVAMKPNSVHEVMLINKESGVSVNQDLAGKSVVSDQSKVASVSPASLNPIPLTIGQTYAGQSGVASSPSQFWFSLNKYVDDLNELLDGMAEYYSSLGPSDCVLSSPSVGSYCCCQYSVDLGWYRAEIMSITGSQADVCFVDFGNSEKVALNDLKVLKGNYQSLPKQAISCSLNKAIPPNSAWSEEAKTAFSDLIIEKDAVIKVIEKSSDNYVVDLLDVNGKHLASDMLLSKGFAADSVQQVSMQDFKPFVMNFNTGDYIDVNPLYCISPHDFHCQVLTQDSIVVFSQMASKLHDVYSCMGPSENTIVAHSKGMPCCTLFPADNTWNRGRITQVNNDNTLKVKFVDYGNEETVSLDQVKVLQSDFLDLPVQSVQCCLSSVKPCTSNQWSDGAVKRFLDLVNQKYFVGEVVNTGGDKLSIELYDTKDDSVDVSIAQVLISENHAISTSQQPKLSHPKLSKLSQLVPSTGDTVYITAVDSPETIYCQLNGTEERLENLMANLKEFYESGQQVALQSISPNELCVALFSEDGAWYRAVAEEVSPEGVTVRFIDYGNSETMSLGNVKAIDNQFMSEQILAIECGLSDVMPVRDDGEWSPEAADFLATAGGDDGFILTIKSDKDTLEVALSDNSGDLSQRLVNEGLAKSSRVSAVSSVVQAPPQQAPPQPGSAETYQSPPVTIGTTVEVYITDVTSPGQFYCQMAEYGDNLDEMMNSICEHYSTMDQSQACITSPKVGQPCIAIFEEDSMWYRAKVESVSQSRATVQFVDYGNTQNVKVSDLKQIEAQFLKLPALAALCTVNPNKSTWSADETENFKVVTGEEKVSAEIIGKEGDRHVVRISQGRKCVTDSFTKTAAHLDIPSQVIQPDQTENIYVAFAKSSSEICVQLASYSDQLDQVMATIEHENKNQAAIKEDQAVPGMVCCAYFEDGWYRAVVKSKPDQGQVMVEYVDYGNTATVPVSELRTVPQSCVALPKQAINCMLEGQGLENVSKETLENTLMEGTWTATFLKTDGQNWTVNLKQDAVDVVDILLINTEVVIKDLNYTYPEVAAGSTAQVFVSHIENPGQFYIQMSSSTDNLDILGNRLNEAYSQPGLTCGIEIGSVCCAQFSEDGCWYRGIVTSLQDDSRAQVRFVDYGNSDVVDKGKIMALKEEFLDLPILAIQCCLDPPGTQWSDEELNKFEALVLDQELTVEFLARQEEQWHVKLSCLETSILDLIRVGETKNVDVIEEKLTIQKKAVSEGQVVECGLSHAENSGLFHLQFLGDPSLDKVTDMIASHYPSLGPTENCLKNCQVGSFCCVKFSEDEQWYRAVVTECCSTSEAKVTFVDYGNSEVAAISSFKTLTHDLCEIPQCSIPCRLAGRKSALSQGEMESLEAQMLDKTLTVTFVKPNEQGWDVNIDVEGKSLNELPAVTDDSKDETKKLSIATLSTDSRQAVKFLMADDESMVWLQPVITENELTTLMNSIAENPPVQPMPVAEVSTGKLCLCRFTEDDEWYRAEVTECKHDQVTVKYVDYGNTETVAVVRVSPISESYLQLPAQAIKCSIYGVEALSEDVLNKLNEEYVEVQLEAEVAERKEDGVDLVRLFKDDKELISNLVEAVVCKEPIPAISQEPLDEPVEENGIEGKNNENRQEDGSESTLKEAITSSDEVIDSNENLSLAVDSKEDVTIPTDNVPPTAAETSRSLQPLDQDDSKNEVITELSEEELAYYSQECDVGENTSVDHVSLTVTSKKDLDHQEDISCDNNHLSGEANEGSPAEIEMSATEKLDSYDSVKDSVEGEGINSSLSVPILDTDAGTPDQTESMELTNENKEEMIQTAQDTVRDESTDEACVVLQSGCTETPILSEDADVPDQTESMELSNKNKEEQTTQDSAKDESTEDAFVVLQSGCTETPILSDSSDENLFETAEATLQAQSSAQQIESEENEKPIQTVQTENVSGTDMLETDGTTEAKKQSLQVQNQSTSEDLQVQSEENDMYGSNTKNKTLNAGETSEQDLQTQAFEVIEDETTLENNLKLTASDADVTSRQAQHLDLHEDSQTQDTEVKEQAMEMKEKEPVLESNPDFKTSDADDTSQLVENMDSHEDSEAQTTIVKEEAGMVDENKMSEADDASNNTQSLDTCEDSQTQATEERKETDMSEAMSENRASEADDTINKVQSLDSHEDTQTQTTGIKEEETGLLHENQTSVSNDISKQAESLDLHKDSQIQSIEAKEVECDVAENNANNETLDVVDSSSQAQSHYSTEDQPAEAAEEEVTDVLKKDEIIGASYQIPQEETPDLNEHLSEAKEEADVAQVEGEGIEKAVGESSNEHGMQLQKDVVLDKLKEHNDDVDEAEKDATSAGIESEEGLKENDDSIPIESDSPGQENDSKEEVNGNIVNGKTTPNGIDSATDDGEADGDGCLSDSALEKLENLLEGPEAEEFSQGAEGRTKNKKSCQPM